jgi:hypothetical protein
MQCAFTTELASKAAAASATRRMAQRVAHVGNVIGVARF